MRKSSFSVVQDEDSDGTKSNSDEELKPVHKNTTKQFKYLDKLEGVKLDDESEEEIMSPKRNLSRRGSRKLSDSKDFALSEVVDKKTAASKSAKAKTARRTPSDSDLEYSENEELEKKTVIKIPNEYNPSLYQNLDVEDEVRELFQYIVKYMPQQLTLDYKFKPFIPDYLPAVGDIDAFLKVMPPETIISGESFKIQEQQLGFAILDEPATTQSDSALLHLQLRASSLGVPQDTADVIVKKVEKVDKNHKVVDKWIKDISDLHKSKSSPFVRYSEPMPDIDDLMQEWPEDMENRLKDHGFPSPDPNMTLAEYTELVCDLFQIPTSKNKIHSLHVLFALYAAVKNSKFYKPSNEEDKSAETDLKDDQPDQLVLD